MDWQSNVERRSSRDVLVTLIGEIAPVAAVLLIAVLGLATVVLVVRRLSGAVAAASEPGWLIVWVLVAAILAAAARAAWFWSPRGGSTAADAIVLFVPLAALLLTAGTLSVTQTPPIVAVALWLVAAAEELATFALFATRVPHPLLPALRRRLAAWRPLAIPFPPRRAVAAGKSAQNAGASATQQGISGLALEGNPSRDLVGNVLQRIERVQSADAGDILSGSVATQFARGQATAHIHLAFCPPFDRVPRLDYRQVAGPAARVKVGQVLPHGVRFDVKLASPAPEPTRLVLDVRAALDQALSELGG